MDWKDLNGATCWESNKADIKKFMTLMKEASIVETGDDYKNKIELNTTLTGARKTLYEDECLKHWKDLPKLSSIGKVRDADAVRFFLGRETSYTALLIWATASESDQVEMTKDPIAKEYLERGAMRWEMLKAMEAVRQDLRTKEHEYINDIYALGVRNLNARLNGRYSFTGTKTVWKGSKIAAFEIWANKTIVSRGAAKN